MGRNPTRERRWSSLRWRKRRRVCRVWGGRRCVLLPEPPWRSPRSPARRRRPIPRVRSPWWCRSRPAATPTSWRARCKPKCRRRSASTVVIVNKGGAAGTLGLIDVARAAPDGYTIALTPNNPLTAQPHLQKLPYGMDSFRYICLTYYAPYVLIAGPKAPFKTFAEFVKFTKAKSENLVYGHPGLGEPAASRHAGGAQGDRRRRARRAVHRRRPDGAGAALRHRDGDHRNAGGRRRQQPADPGGAVGDAARRAARRADHEGARPSGDVVHRRRRDRARQHAARCRRHAGEGLRRTRPRDPSTRRSRRGSMSRRATCRARRSANCSTSIRSTMPTRSNGWARRRAESSPRSP